MVVLERFPCEVVVLNYCCGFVSVSAPTNGSGLVGRSAILNIKLTVSVGLL